MKLIIDLFQDNAGPGSHRRERKTYNILKSPPLSESVLKRMKEGLSASKMSLKIVGIDKRVYMNPWSLHENCAPKFVQSLRKG